MPIIKDGAAIADDWIALGDDAEFAGGAFVIVSLERWRRDGNALKARAGKLGVRLRSDQPPSEIAADLAAFDLVALEFPKFRDGRAYSYARLLRDRYDFRGEVRAVGDVLIDQAHFMMRVGIDALEIPETGPSVEAWQAALGRFSYSYQHAADDRRSIALLRRSASRRSDVSAA